MRTVVLLAAFLLAASANPIAYSLEGSNEDDPDTRSEDVSSADDNSEHNTNINAGEHETSIDDSPHSTEDNGTNDTGEQDISHGEPADYTEDNAANNNGDEHSSSVDNDSTTSTKVSSEDNTSNHADDAATSVNSSDSTDSTEPSTGGNTTNRTEDKTTSSDTSVSTTPTKTETTTQQSTEVYTTPGDADPKDCRNATEKNHTYVLCTFSCQGDEMFTAPDKSPCYLYPGNMTTGADIPGEYGHTEYSTNETGVCYRGDCVRSLAEVTAAPTESSTGTTSSSTAKTADTSMQQGNESYTTPGDADPKDCRNATETNHTYVLCTFSCQGDEMFTAPDKSPCYIYPANVTTEMLVAAKYSLTEHNAEGTGVCFQGNCVRSFTETPAAPTESSPGTTATATTTTTAAETGVETESTINDQASVMNEGPHYVSESFPQHSQSQDTPTGNIASPERPVHNVESTEVEKASSTSTVGPVAMPAALPQDTSAENNNSPAKQRELV